ncbi:hypothetical protein [Cryobacterium sp. PH31-O1]|uniref:hypothetical protein n=1 Tax=Cryobacterium sp. PH31-O1 TaxID=3046306 RepID=UPI0024BAE56B|nr:hypothetical protein [Cryobacterium sp. PH31-O1]MDJ0336642.1 hypothetical protein [Cryobacterium sp. PH31-O1]
MATVAWFNANALTGTNAGQLSAKISIFGCAAAISVAIAGVAFPVAKILKIKKLLGNVGGVTKAVKLLWGASFNYEKVQAVGGAFAALGAELFGITSIRDQCFN